MREAGVTVGTGQKPLPVAERVNAPRVVAGKVARSTTGTAEAPFTDSGACAVRVAGFVESTEESSKGASMVANCERVRASVGFRHTSPE